MVKRKPTKRIEAKKVPVVKIMLSDNEAYSSKAFQSHFEKYIEMQTQKIRTKRENSLWHKFLKFMGLADEKFVDVFGVEVENPRIHMHKTLEERRMILKLLEEFENWKSQQPKKRNRKPVTSLKEFLEARGDLPLKA